MNKRSMRSLISREVVEEERERAGTGQQNTFV